MKQETFTKELSSTGSNGTVLGQIKISLNYISINISGVHAVTHDDFIQKIFCHKVESFIEGEKYEAKIEIRNEPDLLKNVELMMGNLQSKLHRKANYIPNKIQDKLKKLGFY